MSVRTEKMMSETADHSEELETELMTDGGHDTTRGQRWSSAHPERRKRDAQAADAVANMERRKTLSALNHHASVNPGAVVEVGYSRMVDLSGEPGHVQRVSITTGQNHRGIHSKVTVKYLAYGSESDVSEWFDGEREPAGDMTPDTVGASAVSYHTERIYSDPRELSEDRRERAEQYVRERWVPDWTERERVTGQMGDGDE